MRRLLDLAGMVCGDAARARVFEPLVADWQRELILARERGPLAVARAAISGGTAFGWSVCRCALTSGVWIPPARGAALALAAFVTSLALAAANLLLVFVRQGRPLDFSTPLVPAFLMGYSAVVMPPALLAALFLLRRDPRSTVRHAAVAIAMGAALASAVTVWTTPEAINRRFTTFELFEWDREHALANDRAGRIQYPWTAVRQLRPPTTREERLASFNRFMAMRAEAEARRPPVTWRQRSSRSQPVLLTIMFGVMGWTLAALGALWTRAAFWWVVMYCGMLAFTGLASSTVGEVAFPTVRPPFWMATPTFAVSTLALLLTARHRHAAPSP